MLGGTNGINPGLIFDDFDFVRELSCQIVKDLCSVVGALIIDGHDLVEVWEMRRNCGVQKFRTIANPHKRTDTVSASLRTELISMKLKVTRFRLWTNQRHVSKKPASISNCN